MQHNIPECIGNSLCYMFIFIHLNSDVRAALILCLLVQTNLDIGLMFGAEKFRN